jgi:Leucine Rich repeat
MPNLQTLSLEGTGITDASIETLLALRTLTDLDVTDTKMTSDGIARLRQLRPKWEIHSSDGQN